MDLTSLSVFWVVAVLAVGFVLLLGSGHALVYGSARLARTLGVRPMVIGLTVVAFGTSMPEFVVSLIAALRGRSEVALGNIVGSNITNLALILGLAAAVRPIAVKLHLLRLEMPMLAVVCVAFWIACANGALGRVDGLFLTVAFAGYLAVTIRGSREAPPEVESPLGERIQPRDGLPRLGLYIVLGVVGLGLGANWIVAAASELSHRLGVAELLLGLTVVAVGTSLPELATSLMAAWKREGDISLGNILGSNLFNMMGIAGPVALVRPMPVSYDLIHYHLPLMLGVTLMIPPLLRSGTVLGRLEGIFLAVCYLGIFVWWANV